MRSNKNWTKEKIEDYLIKLLVNNCHEILQLIYTDITIIKSESPDFIVGDCTNTIGVEITRALDQNMQKVNFIRDIKFNNISICPTLFEDKQMPKKEIIYLLNKSKDKIIGYPYIGDELEEKVLKDIIEAINKKIVKYDNYLKFHKNILLIHSENRASLDIELVIKKLSRYIFNTNIKFDFIFRL